MAMSFAPVSMCRENAVFEAISGNVIGIVEKPDIIDPQKPLSQQYLVKIGVLDRHGGLPKSDALVVIEQLRKFCETIQ